MKKKILVLGILPCLTMFLCFVACGGNTEHSQSSPSSCSSSETSLESSDSNGTESDLNGGTWTSVRVPNR